MEAVIVGVGLHPFGRFPGKSAMDMAADAVRAALADAGVSWPQVQAGFVGSLEVYNPDAIVGRLGLTGIPLRGVFNGCATAGTALSLAARAIETGEHDLTIAIGMDKHPRGAFAADPSVAGLPSWYGQTGMYLTTHFFGMKINRYMHDHGITHQTLAQVAAKNFRNASGNENAWRRTPLSVAEILASPVLNYPLRQFMYCGPDEGAGAVVLCRADRAHKYAGRPVRVRACTLRSRRTGAFEVQSPSIPVGEQAPSPTVDASREAYEIAGIGPQDVAVAQLQDTDAGSEIIHLAENGLCQDGEQERMIADGETEIGGRLPVNTDGGLIGNGEPIGASGLRQVHELVRQLRGTAGARQVPGSPAVGYAHLYGAPGVSAVTILSLVDRPTTCEDFTRQVRGFLDAHAARAAGRAEFRWGEGDDRVAYFSADPPEVEEQQGPRRPGLAADPVRKRVRLDLRAAAVRRPRPDPGPRAGLRQHRVGVRRTRTPAR